MALDVRQRIERVHAGDHLGGRRHARRLESRSRRRTPSLLHAFDPRRNSLSMLRLALAALVAVTHALAVGFGWQPQFQDDVRLGPTYLGDLAVDAFFVLSGFLVTLSYLRLGSVGRYLWHRAVRILPAFWVCLIVTALIVAPLLAVLEGRPAASVFPGALTYVTDNLALHIVSYDVAGLPTQTHVPHVVNGALWTLFYEFLCYVGVVVLGLAGALTRRRWLLLVAIGVVWSATIASTAGMDLPAWQVRRLAFCFLWGVAGYVFSDRVRIDGRLAWFCLGLVAVALWVLPDYRVLAAPAFAYLCLWSMARLPLTWNPRTDLSYGVYIFHWPIVAVLTVAGFATVGQVGFVLVCLMLAALAAFVSWHLVEAPALAHKGLRAPWRRGAPRRH